MFIRWSEFSKFGINNKKPGEENSHYKYIQTYEIRTQGNVKLIIN